MANPNLKSENTQITLHEHQMKVMTSEARIVSGCSGIQGGKTMIGAIWLRTQISLDTDMSHNYLIVSPTFRLLNQSVLPTFFKIFEGTGTYRAGDSKYTLHDGRVIYIRSLHDAQAVEGIPKVKYVWLDECGLLSNRAWDNVLSRISTVPNARAVLTSTPYYLGNWYHDLYLEWKKGKRQDVDFVVWKSVENPHISSVDIEKLRDKLSPTVFRMKYEASFEQPMGLVYSLGEKNFCEPFAPKGARYRVIAGIDFGFAISSTAIIVGAQDLRTGYWYIIYEFKRLGLNTGDLIQTVKQINDIYQPETFWCDSASPQLINELTLAGLPAQGVEKGPDSVNTGIMAVQTTFNTGKLKLFNNLDILIGELYSYSWDEKTLGTMPKVIKHNDDACDAMRYLIVGAGYHYKIPGSDFKPALSHLEQANAEAMEMDMGPENGNYVVI